MTKKQRNTVFLFFVSTFILLLIPFSCTKEPAQLAPAKRLAITSVCFIPQRPATSIDTASQHILLIGDSMVAGLMHRLQDYCEANGHVQNSVIWYSSSTKWYAQTDTISYFIQKHQPSFIIFVLGANELFIKDIIEKRTNFVMQIVSQFDSIPYIWVGPPNWKKDTGINEMIQNSVDSSHFFLSANLHFDRLSDGAHPTKASSVLWMDTIAIWIMTKSSYRIKLYEPVVKAKNRASKFVTVVHPIEK